MQKLFVKATTVRELLGYLWRERLWWLIPMVVVLLIVGGLIVFAHTAGIASPFLYAIF